MPESLSAIFSQLVIAIKLHLYQLLTMKKSGVLFLALSMAFSGTAVGGDPADLSLVPEQPVSDNFFDAISFKDANIGGILFPHLHITGAFGATTGEQSDLAVNDHDPQREATLQGLEPGLSLRAGMVQGFVTAAGITDASGDFSFTLEEGFLKLVDLPLGVELRGGQYLNRFGFQNSVHNHGWGYVDQNLVNGRFLNEGELITQGGEISINVPGSIMQESILSVSVGGVSTHDHGHEDHGHGEEAEFEAEGANFIDFVVTATWVNQYDINDLNRITSIISGAWGDNQFGRTSQVYGLGVEYLWRENGYGPGGRSLRWRNELMYRNFGAVSGHLPGEEEEEHHDEHEEEHHDEEEEHHDEDEEHHDEEEGRRATLDEFGLYSSLIYWLPLLIVTVIDLQSSK